MFAVPRQRKLEHLKYKMVRNEFEKLVVSLCHAENVISTDEYCLSNDGLPFLNTADKGFFQTWKRVFNIPNNKHPETKTTTVGSNFEMDCCITLTDSTQLKRIFNDVVDGRNCIYALNEDQASWDSVVIQGNQSIAFEFTERCTHISKKI